MGLRDPAQYPPSTLLPTPSAPAPTLSLTKIFILWRSLWGVWGDEASSSSAY